MLVGTARDLRRREPEPSCRPSPPADPRFRAAASGRAVARRRPHLRLRGPHGALAASQAAADGRHRLGRAAGGGAAVVLAAHGAPCVRARGGVVGRRGDRHRRHPGGRARHAAGAAVQGLARAGGAVALARAAVRGRRRARAGAAAGQPGGDRAQRQRDRGRAGAGACDGRGPRHRRAGHRHARLSRDAAGAGADAVGAVPDADLRLPVVPERVRARPVDRRRDQLVRRFRADHARLDLGRRCGRPAAQEQPAGDAHRLRLLRRGSRPGDTAAEAPRASRIAVQRAVVLLFVVSSMVSIATYQ